MTKSGGTIPPLQILGGGLVPPSPHDLRPWREGKVLRRFRKTATDEADVTLVFESSTLSLFPALHTQNRGLIHNFSVTHMEKVWQITFSLSFRCHDANKPVPECYTQTALKSR